MSARSSNALSAGRERTSSGAGGAARSRDNTRTQRTQKPYASRLSDGSFALKFLLPKGQVGCLIGTGGQSIKDLMEVTGTKIYVSKLQDVYPGTSDRVVYMTGQHTDLSAAQTMIWEMIGKVTQAGSDGTPDWNPRLVSESMDDSTRIEGKVSIPSTAAGSVIGKGGATIQNIGEQSGAKIQLSNTRDEPFNTNERIVSLSGTVQQCAAATDLVLAKLVEVPDMAQYVTAGTKYPNIMVDARNGTRYVPPPPGMQSGYVQHHHHQPDVAETLSASTTITIAVPNNVVGNILGRQGATLKEIITLSGANVSISNKGEYIEGTTNRMVTITGPPTGAQTAHTLISNILSTLE